MEYNYILQVHKHKVTNVLFWLYISHSKLDQFPHSNLSIPTIIPSKLLVLYVPINNNHDKKIVKKMDSFGRCLENLSKRIRCVLYHMRVHIFVKYQRLIFC